MFSKILQLSVLLVALACTDHTHETIINTTANDPEAIQAGINPYKFVSEVPLRAGFTRNHYDKNSWANWLQSFPLKKNTTVFLFNGDIKANQDAQFAVLDISVGKENLQQCADAVMRLRAEYFYANKEFNQIHFKDNEGNIYQFKPPYTRENFDKYLVKVFGMCGTASLSKELKSASFEKLEPGCILIRGGFPGHAVIVMDVAENSNGKKIYLLAQSYMPAQDVHLLRNPANKTLSPWYEVNDDEVIETPEYIFRREELKAP